MRPDDLSGYVMLVYCQYKWSGTFYTNVFTEHNALEVRFASLFYICFSGGGGGGGGARLTLRLV